MASECMECVEGRAVALGLCADCLAGEPVEAVVRQIARLTAELDAAREALTIAKTTAANLHDVIRRKDRELDAARERERGYREALEAAGRLADEVEMDIDDGWIAMDRERAEADITTVRRALASTPPDTEGDGGCTV